jgi:hypothetical protein
MDNFMRNFMAGRALCSKMISHLVTTVFVASRIGPYLIDETIQLEELQQGSYCIRIYFGEELEVSLAFAPDRCGNQLRDGDVYPNKGDSTVD